MKYLKKIGKDFENYSQEELNYLRNEIEKNGLICSEHINLDCRKKERKYGVTKISTQNKR